MNKTQMEDGWRDFLELCLKIKSAEDLDDLLMLILTIEERKDIGLRYLIIRELTKGVMTQRDMAEKLKVSIAKITRGSNALKRSGAGMRKFLEESL